MSFLEDTADARETLEVALAFIDAHESAGDDGSSSPFTSSSSSSSSNNTESLSSSPPPAKATQRARRQPRSGDAASSRRQRERKKTETLLLRDQVAQLEAQLAELQHARCSGNSLQVFLERLGGRRQRRHSDNDDDAKHDDSGSDEVDDELLIATATPSAVAVWVEVAKLQAHERLRSQALNAELRDAVGKHVVLAQSLETMLHGKSQQIGLELLRDEQRRFLETSSVLAQNNGLLAAMQQRVWSMNADADATFDHKFWRADAPACAIQLKPHARLGRVVELRMNAPLPCSVESAAHLVWRLAVTMSSPAQTPHFFLERKQLSSSSFRKYYGIRLLNAPGGALELQGTTFAQSFERVGCRNYLWTSVIASSHRGDIFREEGWLSISPVAEDPSTARFQLFYRVFCEPRDAADSESDDGDAEQARATREFVLRALGNRTRSYHQLKQNALVDCVTGFLAAPPLMLPPVTDQC